MRTVLLDWDNWETVTAQEYFLVCPTAKTTPEQMAPGYATGKAVIPDHFIRYISQYVCFELNAVKVGSAATWYVNSLPMLGDSLTKTLFFFIIRIAKCL